MKNVLILLLTFSASSFAANSLPQLNTVSYVDIDRYLGKWYEIARIDQKFQKGCTATTATYTKRKDGDIKVVNECRLNDPNGKLKSGTARGCGKLLGGSGNKGGQTASCTYYFT